LDLSPSCCCKEELKQQDCQTAQVAHVPRFGVFRNVGKSTAINPKTMQIRERLRRIVAEEKDHALRL
jgi:hypothetical protein